MFLLLALVLVTSCNALPDPSSSGAGELKEDAAEPWPTLDESLAPDEDFGGRGPLEDDGGEEESTKSIVEDEAAGGAEESEAEEKEEDKIHSEDEEKEEEEEETKGEEQKHSDEVEEDEEEKKEEERKHSDEEEEKEEEKKEKKIIGSVFDTPLFDVHRLTRYFKQLEDAVEKVFRVDEEADETTIANGTRYSDTTEEEVDSDGNKFIVHKSVVKTDDGRTNTSVIVEDISQDGRTKRSNWEAKRIQ